jgi:hypothetical protein
MKILYIDMYNLVMVMGMIYECVENYSSSFQNK